MKLSVGFLVAVVVVQSARADDQFHCRLTVKDAASARMLVSTETDLSSARPYEGSMIIGQDPFSYVAFYKGSTKQTVAVPGTNQVMTMFMDYAFAVQHDATGTPLRAAFLKCQGFDAAEESENLHCGLGLNNNPFEAHSGWLNTTLVDGVPVMPLTSWTASGLDNNLLAISECSVNP